MSHAVRLALDSNYVSALHSYACLERTAAGVIIELHDSGDAALFNALQFEDTVFGIEAADGTAHLFSFGRVDVFFRLIREKAKGMCTGYLVPRIAGGD